MTAKFKKGSAFLCIIVLFNISLSVSAQIRFNSNFNIRVPNINLIKKRQQVQKDSGQYKTSQSNLNRSNSPTVESAVVALPPYRSQNPGESELDYYKYRAERVVIMDMAASKEVMYVPNSVREVVVSRRSPSGQVNSINFTYQIKFRNPNTWRGDGLSDQTEEVFFNNGLAYAKKVKFGTTITLAPIEKNYTNEQVNRMQFLRDSLVSAIDMVNKELSKQNYYNIVKIMNENYGRTNIMASLGKVQYIVTETRYTTKTVTENVMVQVSATEQALTPVSRQVSEPYEVQVTKNGLKNITNKVLYKKGIKKYSENGITYYKDITETINPGDVVPEFTLEPIYDDRAAELDSSIYFQNIGNWPPKK